MLTPKYLIPITLRQIHNPYFTILKSITTLLRCKILKPRIKRIEPSTWATNFTLCLIFHRVLQTPFIGFMGKFSGSLACFGDSTVFKHNLIDFKRACRVWSLHPRLQSTKSGSWWTKSNDSRSWISKVSVMFRIWCCLELHDIK